MDLSERARDMLPRIAEISYRKYAPNAHLNSRYFFSLDKIWDYFSMWPGVTRNGGNHTKEFMDALGVRIPGVEVILISGDIRGNDYFDTGWVYSRSLKSLLAFCMHLNIQVEYDKELANRLLKLREAGGV